MSIKASYTTGKSTFVKNNELIIWIQVEYIMSEKQIYVIANTNEDKTLQVSSRSWLQMSWLHVCRGHEQPYYRIGKIYPCLPRK